LLYHGAHDVDVAAELQDDAQPYQILEVSYVIRGTMSALDLLCNRFPGLYPVFNGKPKRYSGSLHDAGELIRKFNTQQMCKRRHARILSLPGGGLRWLIRLITCHSYNVGGRPNDSR
jgi:hypothetical protein